MIKRINIPDHIFWPGLVVVILGISFVANAALVYVSSRDGGPQVVPGYEQEQAELKASRAAAAVEE